MQNTEEGKEQEGSEKIDVEKGGEGGKRQEDNEDKEEAKDEKIEVRVAGRGREDGRT